jgi:hypothetical protein
VWGILAAPNFVGENDRLGDFSLRFPALTALPLDGEVGLFFRNPELALRWLAV